MLPHQVGLPARSAISGAIMLIVPNVMGVCLWSPPLDVYDNSVRAVQFCREFVKKFHLHNYDLVSSAEIERKLDPKRVENEGGKTPQVALTLFAASKGDLIALRRYSKLIKLALIKKSYLFKKLRNHFFHVIFIFSKNIPFSEISIGST